MKDSRHNALYHRRGDGIFEEGGRSKKVMKKPQAGRPLSKDLAWAHER